MGHDVIYGVSEITGTYYKILEWDRVDDERVKCKRKEEVSKEDVPEEWISRLEQ